jgi:hypothetical protein
MIKLAVSSHIGAFLFHPRILFLRLLFLQHRFCGFGCGHNLDDAIDLIRDITEYSGIHNTAKRNRPQERCNNFKLQRPFRKNRMAKITAEKKALYENPPMHPKRTQSS